MDITFQNPAYAAYLDVTLVNDFINNRENFGKGPQNTMSFEEFLKRIEKNEVVDPGNVRPLSQREYQDKLINIQYGGNSKFQNQEYAFIERAYSLGMSDLNGVLINSKA
ncbi:hypothetical protein M5W68_05895 [Paenibacillus larvae]|uniref:hypothetical protein n=1 Tax=Paenibacillus larvae TaxID=1464 RepID=UPI00227EFCEB|nr:hypothetical protein [Paenibacillus larvae]MCY9508913.1 hypothetical protein [Paenibacillus larvae]MCY9524699.1 hypothetical protein [Paenibacillus larvae]